MNGTGEDGDRDPGEERDVGDPGDGSAPLDELARDVRQRRETRRDEGSELFEEMTVDDVDSEAVWESLLETDDAEAEGPAVGAGAEAERVGSPPGADDRPESLLPTAEFCERCPHLSAPPEVACEREGTDIVEVENSEHFRVRGCPFAGRERVDFGELD